LVFLDSVIATCSIMKARVFLGASAEVTRVMKSVEIT
jgi:hypothetical protein